MIRKVAAALIPLWLTLVSTSVAQANQVTFSATGSEQAFTVPAGVQSIQVVAVGGHGGQSAPISLDGMTGIPGGAAARVSGELAVTPGEQL